MDVDQKVEQVMNRLPEAKRVVYDAEITALRSQLEKAQADYGELEHEAHRDYQALEAKLGEVTSQLEKAREAAKKIFDLAEDDFHLDEIQETAEQLLAALTDSPAPSKE